MTTETSIIKTPRAEFLAHNPKAAKLQKRTIAEFLRYANGYFEDVGTVGKKFVTGAENARLAGTYLSEYVESLPGKKLTADFYEQEKELFVTAKGLRLTLDQLNWFMSVAERRKNEPFKLISDVFPEARQMLITSGQMEQTERGPQVRQVPLAPTIALKAYFDLSITKTIDELRTNPSYCPDGHLLPDLKLRLLEDLRPKLAAWDEAREWLRGEFGC